MSFKGGAWRTYHLPLFFTVDEVVVVLHADELVPPILLSNVLQRLKFPRRHRAGTDVSNPALLHNIIQRLHDLLPWGAAVQPVDLQNIDVCTQALYALLDSVEDVFAAKTDLVDHVAIIGRDRCDTKGWVFFVDAEVAFREEDDLVTGDVVLLEGFGNDLLGDAVGVDVGLHVSVSSSSNLCECCLIDVALQIICTYCVPSIYAVLVGVLKDGQCGVLVQNPGLPLVAAEAHGAQDDLGHLQAGLAQATQR